MSQGIRGSEPELRYMQRTYVPKTKVTLVADTENYLTVPGGTRWLTIDSPSNLRIAWSATVTDIGIDNTYPTKVLAGIPTEIIVPIDQFDDYMNTMYCHIYHETGSGDVLWATE